MTDAPSSPVTSSTARPDESALPKRVSWSGEVFQTRKDYRPFGIGEWASFLFTIAFAAALTIALMVVVFDMWRNVLSGDYRIHDLRGNTGETIAVCLVVLPFLLFIFVIDPVWEPTRRATTFDASSGTLVLTNHNIVGLCWSSRLPLADLAEVRVSQWCPDGETSLWHLQAVTTLGAAMTLSGFVKDRAEVVARAARLRVALVAMGWTTPNSTLLPEPQT
jgi:hypothetical protein